MTWHPDPPHSLAPSAVFYRDRAVATTTTLFPPTCILSGERVLPGAFIANDPTVWRRDAA